MTAQDKGNIIRIESQYIDIQFNHLTAFVEEHKALLEDSCRACSIELPPCMNVGHINPLLDEKICLAYTDREVDIVCAWGKIVASIADYGEDDWVRDCPADFHKKDFDNWEECALFIGKLNGIPEERMTTLIAEFQMME